MATESSNGWSVSPPDRSRFPVGIYVFGNFWQPVYPVAHDRTVVCLEESGNPLYFRAAADQDRTSLPGKTLEEVALYYNSTFGDGWPVVTEYHPDGPGGAFVEVVLLPDDVRWETRTGSPTEHHLGDVKIDPRDVVNVVVDLLVRRTYSTVCGADR